MTTKKITGPLAALGLVLAATACSGSVVHTYKTFASAVDHGASCSELFDQRSRFHDGGSLQKIDRELERIGCHTRRSVRTR